LLKAGGVFLFKEDFQRAWVLCQDCLHDAGCLAVVGEEGSQVGCIAHDPVFHAVMEPVDDPAGALFEVRLQQVRFED